MKTLPYEFEADWQYMPGSSVRVRCAFKLIGKRISIHEIHYYIHRGEDGPGWVEMCPILGDICEAWLLPDYQGAMIRFAKDTDRRREEDARELAEIEAD